MKENKYDDPQFFKEYKQMARSTGGLEAAGEWPELLKMIPDLQGKRVLDLGCGFGWHCRYAVEKGAKSCGGRRPFRKDATRSKGQNRFALN